jgi:tripartite-type tricarboxylate transporter receptor subunit TctC
LPQPREVVPCPDHRWAVGVLDLDPASLGQPLVIENVSGAGGSIGVGRVARAASDGYTLGIGSSDTHVLNGAVYRLGYDLLKDIEPIALIAKGPLLIVARRDLPARDLKEMISWLNANHEKVSMGTLGTGSSQQLCGVELQNITGVSWSLVPYRGAAPLLQDLLGGQIDLTCAPPAVALPLIQGGQIKAFAVAAKNRLASAPDIPSVDEVGLDGFYSAERGRRSRLADAALTRCHDDDFAHWPLQI